MSRNTRQTTPASSPFESERRARTSSCSGIRATARSRSPSPTRAPAIDSSSRSSASHALDAFYHPFAYAA